MSSARFPVRSRRDETDSGFIFIANIFISFLYPGFGLFHVTKGFYRDWIAEGNFLTYVSADHGAEYLLSIPEGSAASPYAQGGMLFQMLKSAVRHTRLEAYLVSISLIAAATFLCTAVFNLVPEASLSLIYLVAIMISAQLYGLWPAILSSLLGILAWDFFFTQPYFSLELESERDVFTLIFFMVTALIMSGMTAVVRHQNRQLALLATKNRNLYDFARDIASIGSIDEIISFTIQRISALLSRNASVALADRGGSGNLVVFSQGQASDEALSDTELSAALLLNELPQSRVTRDTAFLPLTALRGRVGAVRIKGIIETPLSAPEEEQLSAMLSQVAVAIERIWLSEEHRSANLVAETERMRNALLLSVSHDLRTPLTTIIGSLSTMELPQLDGNESDHRELASIALTEAQRLDRFIANLLDMTRLELGDLKVTLSPTIVDDVVSSVLQRSQALLQSHKLSVRVGDDLPPVQANFDLLEQAIFNLVDNAGRYCPAPAEIEIRARLDHDTVVVQIADQGPGISEKLAGTLFQKFARFPQGDAGPSGTGLGLAIVKGFVDAMGGSIAAANRPDGSGTIFTIRLLTAPYRLPDIPVGDTALTDLH
jgi:two-component system sensor histidine kinase KdpD